MQALTNSRMSLQLQNALKPEKDQKQGYQTPRTISISVAIIVVVVAAVMKKVFYSQARRWNAIMALRVYQKAVLLEIGKRFSDVIISLLTDSLIEYFQCQGSHNSRRLLTPSENI